MMMMTWRETTTRARVGRYRPSQISPSPTTSVLVTGSRACPTCTNPDVPGYAVTTT